MVFSRVRDDVDESVRYPVVTYRPTLVSPVIIAVLDGRHAMRSTKPNRCSKLKFRLGSMAPSVVLGAVLAIPTLVLLIDALRQR